MAEKLCVLVCGWGVCVCVVCVYECVCGVCVVCVYECVGCVCVCVHACACVCWMLLSNQNFELN